jgi:hypothetical protein
MTAPTFEWDAEKAAESLRKHGVAFEEALMDSRIPWPRYTTILPLIRRAAGHHHKTLHPEQVATVSFTERRSRIRIISARPATRAERQDYEENA